MGFPTARRLNSNDDKQNKIEWARLEFERDKFESELNIRREELQIRRVNIERTPFRSPLFLGIMAAVISLLGNIAATMYNGSLEREKIVAQNELQDRRSQASLVLEAVKTGNPDSAAENLQFLLDAQLISDEDATLANYLKSRKPGTGIYLPSSQSRGEFTDPPRTADPRIEVFSSRVRCQAARKEQPSLPRSPDTDLRVVTWNLEFLGQSDSGPGANKDVAWLACALAWLDPDAIAIQEIDGANDPMGALALLTEELKRQTKASWIPVLQSCKHRQMLGFLVRQDAYQVLSSDDVWYLNTRARNASEACKGLRPGLVVQVKARDTPAAKDHAHQAISIVNLHADAGSRSSDYESREKLRQTLPHLAQDEAIVASDRRLIVLGDFNAIGNSTGISSSDEALAFAKAFAEIPTRPMTLATTGETCTYIWRSDCVAIDHIAIDRRFPNADQAAGRSFGYCTIAKQFGIGERSLAARELLSDHCPVVIDLPM